MKGRRSMARLGVTASAQYFDRDTTAHIELESDKDFSFKGLCGQLLSYCRPETNVYTDNAPHRQKMCTRCIKRREQGER